MSSLFGFSERTERHNYMELIGCLWNCYQLSLLQQESFILNDVIDINKTDLIKTEIKICN